MLPLTGGNMNFFFFKFKDVKLKYIIKKNIEKEIRRKKRNMSKCEG